MDSLTDGTAIAYYDRRRQLDLRPALCDRGAQIQTAMNSDCSSELNTFRDEPVQLMTSGVP